MHQQPGGADRVAHADRLCARKRESELHDSPGPSKARSLPLPHPPLTCARCLRMDHSSAWMKSLASGVCSHLP